MLCCEGPARYHRICRGSPLRKNATAAASVCTSERASEREQLTSRTRVRACTRNQAPDAESTCSRPDAAGSLLARPTRLCLFYLKARPARTSSRFASEEGTRNLSEIVPSRVFPLPARFFFPPLLVFFFFPFASFSFPFSFFLSSCRRRHGVSRLCGIRADMQIRRGA